MDLDTLSSYNSESRTDNSADTISSFIADWVQIKYFYSEAASLAQELCETLLASNAIRAIVTHRVKQGHRLEAKLRERVRKLGREYRSAKEIRDDVVDLAGVRIALYFPSDREKIDKIIHDAFAEVKHKSFPENENKRISDSVSVIIDKASEFEQRFHGYSADHYRVRMRVENLATKKLRDDFQKTNPVIEIQVASVLMHAWAEIDHDLVYKTLTSGPASQQELRLLDATNGLVHTGEVLLQQLQTAMDDRVAYQNKPFSEQYELLSFLRGQIKKAKGSMEHLDVLLLVLKITGLDSPRRLGEMLEGFILPAKGNAPVALVILEHILCSLGEEQRRTNNLYLRPKSVVVKDLEIDETNPKCYNTNVETRDRILDQRDILEMTVSVADIMRFPEKSILVVEGMPQKFRKFYALYNLVHFATVRPFDKTNKDSEKWLCEISLRELDPLWTWFETNDDVLFRVSLLLARMNVEEIDQELIKLRPSSGFQRLPSVYEPNAGYLSPGYMSPGTMSPGYFSPCSDDTESRFSRIPEGSGTPMSSPRGGSERSPSTQDQRSSPKPTRRGGSERSPLSFKNKGPSPQPVRTSRTIASEDTPAKNEWISPTVPRTSGKSDTEEEEDEDEDEDDEDPSPIVIPERTRRPYIDKTPKPEPKRRPSERRNAASAPEGIIREERPVTNPVRPSPERRTSNQAAYVEDETSEDSDAEPSRPVVKLHQDSSRRPPSSPRPREREREAARNRVTASMPGESRQRDRERAFARDRGAASMPGESAMPIVPEVPEPPDAGPQEYLEDVDGGQIEYDREYRQHIRNETASMPSMPAIEPARPRRRDTGRSRRNDYYRSNEPALRARFEPASRVRSQSEYHPPPAMAPPRNYDYQQPMRRPYSHTQGIPMYPPAPRNPDSPAAWSAY
ncbi:uncharacterized protein PAC_01183 [Phialocephala subalpina]|uniref:RelA/SpoT domain-containing protein n=1 Tax=Phialocephala subalpina TaxID=576137 RepID=A0A1L7WEZ1_9HELO|nr:uncharacterized protein PAC_01183 [Phialocephala subalpina]